MTRLAITGHRELPEQTAALVDRELRDLAAATTDLTGLSCLADGADQLFARAVVDTGGTLEVIVPAERYRDGLPAEAHGPYDELFAQATVVHHMGFVDSTSESHMAASRHMIDQADTPWRSGTANQHAATAEPATSSLTPKKPIPPVSVVWPAGSTRD